MTSLYERLSGRKAEIDKATEESKPKKPISRTKPMPTPKPTKPKKKKKIWEMSDAEYKAYMRDKDRYK